jgi:hypothetical protein
VQGREQFHTILSEVYIPLRVPESDMPLPQFNGLAPDDIQTNLLFILISRHNLLGFGPAQHDGFSYATQQGETGEVGRKQEG